MGSWNRGVSPASPGFRHLLTDDNGVSGLGIDPCSDGLTAARYRVGVLLPGHYTVLDDLRAWRRQLAAHHGRRWRRWRLRWRYRDRRLLGGTAKQAQKQNKPQVFHGTNYSQLAHYNPVRVTQPIALGIPNYVGHARKLGNYEEKSTLHQCVQEPIRAAHVDHVLHNYRR
jgi:hypothetical protein